MTSINVWRIVAVAVLACSATNVHASQLWGVDSGSRPTINVVPIDLGTGAPSPAVQIATPQTAASDDFASDPLRQPNLIWLVRWNINGSRLVAFDPFEEQLVANVLLDSPSRMHSLAIDPTNGSFYGASATDLYVINKTSGVTKHVGPTNASRALGFDALGNLFGVSGTNDFVSVNTLTGATTTIAQLGFQNFEDLATDPDTNLLYGLASNGLYQVDPTNGGITLIGNSAIRSAGLAFTDVPEPTAATLALVLALVVVARRDTR